MSQGTDPDPLELWGEFPIQTHIFRLMAFQIFSIVPNSASLERQFSILGLIKTKVRNRLSVNRLEQHSFIRQFLKTDHAQAGRKRKRSASMDIEDMFTHNLRIAASSEPEFTSDSQLSDSLLEEDNPDDTSQGSFSDALQSTTKYTLKELADCDPTLYNDFDSSNNALEEILNNLIHEEEDAPGEVELEENTITDVENLSAGDSN